MCIHAQFSHLAPREVWLPGGRRDTLPKMTPQSSIVSMTGAEDEEDMAAINMDIEVGCVGLYMLIVN